MGNKVSSRQGGPDDFAGVGLNGEAVIDSSAMGPRPPMSTPRKSQKQVAPAPVSRENSGVTVDDSSMDPPTPQENLSRKNSMTDMGGSRRGSHHSAGHNSSVMSHNTDLEAESQQSSISSLVAEQNKFDFNMTEGQSRRTLMADFEFECSEITPTLFVGGAKVAGSLEILRKVGIRRIVNCSAGVVPDHFRQSDSFEYMSLNMVDGRDDDITWFVCQVLQFISKGTNRGIKTLVHCEKGISRSCSFVIAYIMWSTKGTWNDCFNHVKLRRQVCNPNTAFTCNIMELNNLLLGAGFAQPVLLRYAAHLPHDMVTAVLKPVRSIKDRKLVKPKQSLLDPSGIFVIQPADNAEEDHGGHSSRKPLFMWVGAFVEQFDVEDALKLATQMLGVLSPASRVEVVRAGNEPRDFWDNVDQDGPYNSSSSLTFADLWPRAAMNALKALSEGKASAIEVPTSTLPVDEGPRQREPVPLVYEVSPPEEKAREGGRDKAEANPALKLASPPPKPAKPVKPPKGAAGLTRVSPAPVQSLNLPLPANARSTPGASGGTPNSSTPGTSTSATTAGGAIPNPANIRRTPTPTLSGSVRRTPPSIKSPQDVGLARGPTPVEEMSAINNTEEDLARRLSAGSRGGGDRESRGSSAGAESDGGNVRNPGEAAPDSLLSQHQRQASLSLQHAPHSPGENGGNRPLLYVLSATGNGETGYEWQAMGVYDDEDLVEEDIFLLYVPHRAKKHFVWVGTEFEDLKVLDLPTEAFKEWACNVNSGECEGWVDVFPVDLKVQLSGAESDEFWDTYSRGF